MASADQRRALPEPWWIRKRNADTVVVRTDSGPAEFRCEPPLTGPMEPGAAVVLTRGETRVALRLFPVPGVEDLLVGVEDGWAVAICSPFLEELVNHIAHDLRNLTFTVSLQAEIAQRQAREAKPHLDAILSQLGKVHHYLERMLLYGRKPRLSLATLDVATFVQEKLRSLRHAWPADQPPLSLRVNIGGDAGVARWDPQLIGAALDAVLENAAQAAPPGTDVEVSVLGKPETVTLEVRDHGAGIPPELLPKVFFPMVARRVHGLGLGLPTAKKLVEAHGGKIELTSSPGGTTVRLVLPREARDA